MEEELTLDDVEFDVVAGTCDEPKVTKVVKLAHDLHTNGGTCKNVEVKKVNSRFRFIVFEKYPTNFNGPSRIALTHNMVISSLRDPEKHDGQVGFYYKEVTHTTEEVEKTITVEEEVTTFK